MLDLVPEGGWEKQRTIEGDIVKNFGTSYGDRVGRPDFSSMTWIFDTDIAQVAVFLDVIVIGLAVAARTGYANPQPTFRVKIHRPNLPVRSSRLNHVCCAPICAFLAQN